MFSTGQWVFAAIFFVAFVVLIIYSYRKDLQLHKKYYKGTIYIFIGFILFVIFLFAVKSLLKP